MTEPDASFVPPPVTLDALDAARAFMRAWNRRDLATVLSAYHIDARAQLFAPVAREDEEAWEGREAIAAGFERFFTTFDGALGGGQFFDVRTIARIETGWTHVEWVAGLQPRDPDGAGIGEAPPVAFAGYFHFRIRDGLIAEQRTVAHEAPASSLVGREESEPAIASGLGSTGAGAAGGTGVASPGAASTGEGAPARSPRTYPSRPIVGVGAVIIVDGRIVLIKRKYEPLAGQWSLPGGSLEVGETLEAGVAREMLEETGLHVEVGPVIDVFDRILLDADRRVRYHFVLIDYLCVPVGGVLRADSDVADARLVDIGDLAVYRLTPKADEVIRKGYDLYLRRQAK